MEERKRDNPGDCRGIEHFKDSPFPSRFFANGDNGGNAREV